MIKSSLDRRGNLIQIVCIQKKSSGCNKMEKFEPAIFWITVSDLIHRATPPRKTPN